MLARSLLVALLVAPSSAFAPSSACAPMAASRARGKNLLMSAQGGPDQYSEKALLAAGILGVAANPIMDYSLFVLKTTGCGLPAGPFGLLGAAEGVSYLVVIGFVASALVQKVRTGSGLPAGPLGLLGAAEGLSFLTFVAGLVVLGFQLTDYGYVPEAVPIEGGICTGKYA